MDASRQRAPRTGSARAAASRAGPGTRSVLCASPLRCGGTAGPIRGTAGPIKRPDAREGRMMFEGFSTRDPIRVLNVGFFVLEWPNVWTGRTGVMNNPAAARAAGGDRSGPERAAD